MQSKMHPSNKKLPVTVYNTGLNTGFFKTIIAIILEFPKANSLGYRMAARNIKSRYRQSLLGIFWALIPPIGNAAIWIILNKNNVISLGSNTENYSIFVLTGTTLWSIFTISVLTPIQLVQSNSNILTKINFPRESLIYAAIYEIFLSTFIAFIIILAEFIIFKIPLSTYTLLFIPGLILLMLMGLTISLLILQISLLYKDVQFALPSTLQFAMYLSPVVYNNISIKGAAAIFNYNPLSPVLNFTRAHLINQPSTVDINILILIAICTFLLLILGFAIQRITAQILIERMGA